LRIIAEGDIVLVHEDNKWRNNWKLGKVDSLIPDKDGEIGGANVTESIMQLTEPINDKTSSSKIISS
jgi:hypothetical protein